MKKLFVILLLLLLAVVISAGCVQDYPKYPLPPLPDGYELTPHSGAIKSEEAYFTGLNEHYNLGLTEKEIKNYADELKNGYLKDAERGENRVDVDDLVEFHAVVGSMINLDQRIYEGIIYQILAPPSMIGFIIWDYENTYPKPESYTTITLTEEIHKEYPELSRLLNGEELSVTSGQFPLEQYNDRYISQERATELWNSFGYAEMMAYPYDKTERHVLSENGKLYCLIKTTV